MFRITPQRLGNFAVQAKHTLSRIDHAFMLGGRVAHMLHEHAPSNRLTKAAAKGATSYAQIREKVLEGGK